MGRNAASLATSAAGGERQTCALKACSATFLGMFTRLAPALLLAALIASASNAASTTAPAKSAPANAVTTKSATSAWKPAVPFIEDDFGRALALAKERKLPVFIEGWAPW